MGILVVITIVLAVAAVILAIVFFPVLIAAAIIAAIAVFIFAAALIIRRLQATTGCRLVTRLVLRDTCEGNCPAGQVCIATATRPYGPRFLSLRPQAAACACRPIISFGGAGGTPAPESDEGNG
jgi:hypothetical protein